MAFRDLAQRRAEEIRGPRPAWIPVILVNWIGPAAYFVFGVRRSTR
ncbi:PLDc N-terminal domain-containing protein [Microbacterium sp. A204]